MTVRAALVREIMAAVRRQVLLPDDLNPPCWLSGAGPYPAEELLPCRNGLLHVKSRTLLPHTPDFFCLGSVDYDYDPAAPEPKEFLKFLQSIWQDDQESIACLQEIFGLMLTAATHYQKAFMLIGPSRGGRGTIGRTLRRLVGNSAGPSMKSFGEPFGLEPFIGKPLAVIGDARDCRFDGSVISARILSITGEDALQVNRKNKPYWTGQLPTRLVFLTNELPYLGDASGALPGRFILLRMTISFAGREDVLLEQKLSVEFPGILNWSLAGADSLRDRGRFIQPKSASALLQSLGDLASPISQFLREKCETGKGLEISRDKLFHSWESWCIAQNKKPGNKATLGKLLHAALPELGQCQHDEKWFYTGVKLKEKAAADG